MTNREEIKLEHEQENIKDDVLNLYMMKKKKSKTFKTATTDDTKTPKNIPTGGNSFKICKI